MLRALCLLALLLPAASAQEIEPFTVGTVTADSVLHPLFHFDGETWSWAYPEDILSRGLTRWEVPGDTTRVGFTNTSLQQSIGFGMGEQTLALSTTWTGGKVGFGLAFSPRTPPGELFLPADTSVGGPILLHAALGSGWKAGLRWKNCWSVSYDRPRYTRQSHTLCIGRGESYSDVGEDAGFIEVTALFSDPRRPTTHVRYDVDGKSISDWRAPLFLVDTENKDYVLGFARYYEGNGHYIGTPGSALDGELPVVLIER